jgi:hypothetical protein
LNRISYILIIVIIYLVCSARSCTEDDDTTARKNEQYIVNLKESVKHIFMSDTLSDQLLRSFEITATEKLNDFADYMKIVSDTTLDLRFRQHAAELVRDLFVSDEIGIYKWNKLNYESSLNTLELLIDHSLVDGLSYWTRPSQIKVINPYIQVNDSTLTGSLSFIKNFIPIHNTGQIEILPGEGVIDIYIIKKIKYFGNTQLRVWDIYLGSIR